MKTSKESTMNNPPKKKKYKLSELLKQCDFSIPMDKEEKEWEEFPPVGEEIC